jgi:hypothetical protein
MRLYESLGFRIFLTLGGQPLTLPYSTPDGAYNDESKGKITLTVQKVNGDVAPDAADVPIDHIIMYANGSVYSEATLTVAYGMGTAGRYIATIWYHVKNGSSLTKRALKIIAFDIEGGVQATAPS